MKKRELPVWEEAVVESISSDGRGIARVNGKVVFIDFAVPGDVVDVVVSRNKKNYAEGRIHRLITTSPLRITPQCSHFGVCGGCKWQQVHYSEQLRFKRQIVADAFQKIGKVSFPPVPEVIGCANDFYYRNKLEFTFTDRRWLTEEEINSGDEYAQRKGLGFHVAGNFSGVVDVAHCYLQADPSNQIRTAIKDYALAHHLTFFNLKEQKGLLRNLLIRTATTGEVMVLVSFHEDDTLKIHALMAALQQQFPFITSLLYVVNPKRNDTIYDLPVQVFAGREYITEQLGDYRFKIGPKSFFQTNTRQAEVLYDVVKNFAGLNPDSRVYDLYTGVGSIALYLSKLCKSMVGIEQVAAAIDDAKENARINRVENCSFYAGDVRAIFQEEFIGQHGKPDVVITDPPRAGMHEDVVKTLLWLEAPTIVYVSCNAATQARDCQLLAEKYAITKLQPVDMFPQTTHIENVALLQRNDRMQCSA